MRPGLSYVVNSLNPGGTERLVVEMSRAFSQNFRVEVVCLDTPGHWADPLRAAGVPVHCLWRQPGFDTSMPLRLAERFLEHEADIVHAHQCTPWFYSALARLRTGRPKLLLEEHGRFYPETEKRLRILVNRHLIRRLTHRFVAVSADIAERLVRYEGLRRGDIEVIYNGVTPEPRLPTEERMDLRRDLGIPADRFLVGTVGRFDPIKNLPMLVRSLVEAGAREPLLHGLLVGDGPEMAVVRSLVESSPMRERVTLTGYRGDARRLMQCLDLFVLPSFSEGTSMALLEAMAAGVPAVVTRVGGNAEIVLEGRTGWVIASEATAELTEAILAASANHSMREAFAQAGHDRFEERFSMNRMLDSYRALYDQLLEAC